MLFKSFLFLVLIAYGIFDFSIKAQSIIVQSAINLPKDTIVKNQLIFSLNEFLNQKENSNKENTYVLKEYLPETSDLLDEMKGVGQNAKLKDPDFYKCYLTNLVEISDHEFIIQLSYIGIKDNVPFLGASFRLQAKKLNDKFFFNSPLKQNTISWKIKKFQNLNCFYKESLNVADVKAYQKTVALYNRKLKTPDHTIDFYYCDDFTEAARILGIDYKLSYNGLKSNSLSSHENNIDLVVNGDISFPQRFDPHDLWHDRLRMVIDSKIINRPVDEGCAYLYGGSWGLTWEEVLRKFKTYTAAHPDADWLKLYTETTYFEGGNKPLIITYILNAFIIQKVEKEKGFAPMITLLTCGLRQTDDANYFAALQKLTGINKSNFNMEMRKLIDASKF